VVLHLSDQFKKDLKVYRKKRALKESAKIWELILEIQTYWERPLEGKGNPELLKHLGANVYSRRITGEHRLIYRLGEGHIELISCIGHYTSV